MKKSIKSFIPCCFRKERSNIPIIRLHGMITAQNTPFKNTISLSGCSAMLEKAFNFKKSPAVALIVNSPGGSPVQSRLIFQRIRDLAEENNKEVLVFIEDLAVSGGYMIACSGNEIYADPFSIVGSIGVVSSSFGFTELLQKIGIERRVHTSGKNKVLFDPFLPEKKSSIEYLKILQNEIHEIFIKIVQDRRKNLLQDNDNQIFSGMFWTGIQGKKLGLIDEIGDLRSILRKKYGKSVNFRLISPSLGLFGCKTMRPHLNIIENILNNINFFIKEKTIYSRYGSEL